MSRIVRIADIAEINRESIKSNCYPYTILYLDTGNITKNKIENLQFLNTVQDTVPSRAQRKVKLNTIIYSTVRPNQEHYGIIDKENVDLIVSSGFATIDIIDDQINPKFIYYLLSQRNITHFLHTIGMNAVSSYPSISSEDIGNLKFKIPNNLIQNYIAKILSDLDSKIELNNKINKELESMAKLLYDYWFVQFDFPDENGKPYKSSGGKMVYNQELKKEIPEGWEVKELSKWIIFNKCGDWGKDTIQEDYCFKVLCIRGTDLNGLSGESKLSLPVRFINKNNTFKVLEKGDIIIEISGGSNIQSTGRISLISENTLNRFNIPLICSNFCKAITLYDEYYTFNFLYLWKMIYKDNIFFNWESKTSGIKNLLFEEFTNNFYTSYPKEEIVKKFYNKMNLLHFKIQMNLKENDSLSLLRDFLLPMLMNGQVKVKD